MSQQDEAAFFVPSFGCALFIFEGGLIVRKRSLLLICVLGMMINLMGPLLVETKAYTQGVDGMGPVVIAGGRRDFRWPVPGYYNLQSCFYDQRNHCAIDISAGKGNSVIAAYPGTVVATYTSCSHNYSKSKTCCNDGFGNYVVLGHNYTKLDGTTITLYSRYSHLTSVYVSVGETVAVGKSIGTIGSTGYSQGFHLDFQILYGNWKPYRTYSIDPYSNQLLELPSNLQVYDSWNCGKTYYALISEVYATPIEKPQVTITFDAYGGTVSTTTKVVTAGGEIGTLPVPQRSGYEFAGWYRLKTSVEDPIHTSTTFSESTTLYAHWTKIKDMGNKITFDPNGGYLPQADLIRTIDGFNTARREKQLIVYNCEGLLVETNYFGYEVAVNSENKVIDKRDYGDERNLTVPNGGFVLSGHTMGDDTGGGLVNSISIGDYVAYDENAMKVYVYADKNAYLFEQKYVSYGSPYGTLPTLTHPELAFAGWYTKPSGGTRITDDTYYCASTLYAHWKCQHDYTVTVIPETCTQNGVKTYTCSGCGDTYTQAIAPKGHSYQSGTCTVCGASDPDYSTLTGLYKVNGEWYYYRNGVVATEVTNLIKYNGEWWYVVKGRVASEVTDLIKYNGAWYYIYKGKLAGNTTNLIKYHGEWWYVVKGRVASEVTDLIKYNGEWWYVVKGKVASNTTTLVNYNGGWYYLIKGKLAAKTTTLVKYNNEWWYVVKGKVASGITALVQYNGGWYYMVKGKLAAKTTTLVKYNGAWYYVKNGAVDWGYTGTFFYNGKTYNIKKGRVV